MLDANQLLTDLFRAYYCARKNKRKTINALRFELNFESRLFRLYEDILQRKYQISRSICFISFKPVKREIFAGDFRDRIIHHLIFNYISPIFERVFINDAYSCRVGRGTSYGINRIDYFIRVCSDNYKSDCYILKLDIKGYFMAIDKTILYKKIETVLLRYQSIVKQDINLVLWLIRKVIFHDSKLNCYIKGQSRDWLGLPKSKSLFYAKQNKGLPIGNLTSQLFGNVYLNDFDHFIVYGLGCKYYGRYVDDCIIVHQEKDFLKSLIPKIREYLAQDTELELHPNKIYLQHYTKGVVFLGAIIKPYRRYIRNRTKGNWHRAIGEWHSRFVNQSNTFTKAEWENFASSMNSYFGIMRSCNSYKLRHKMSNRILSLFSGYIFVCDASRKVVLKNL